jgi:hypothetical protein
MRIFGDRIGKVSVQWRKLHNQELPIIDLLLGRTIKKDKRDM